MSEAVPAVAHDNYGDDFEDDSSEDTDGASREFIDVRIALEALN